MSRRQQGLYRRGYGVFNFRYRDKDGAWREKSCGTTDRKEALDFKQKWEEDLAADLLPTDAAERTVEQACTRWVDQHVLSSPRARANERSFLRQLLRSTIAPKKLKQITMEDLRDYQAWRSRTVGPRAINVELSILIRVLKNANLWKRGLEEHYRKLREPEGEVGIALSSEELLRLETAAAKRDAWLVCYCTEVLAANTGLRGGEIKKVRMGQVDLENRRLVVTRASTKTDAGSRTIELNSAALWAITRLYQRAQTHGSKESEHYLLPADRGRHTKASDPLKGKSGFDPGQHQMGWRTAWRNLRKMAADSIREEAAKEKRELTREEKDSISRLEMVRFHDMRHTFITRMAEQGVPLQVVSAMVGHMSARITRHYTHVSGAAARQAVEMLDKINNAGRFVDVFVDVGKASQTQTPKLLN